MQTIGEMKAARALLGWSQEDLAGASGVSIPSIKRIEAGSDLSTLRKGTREKIEAAFAGAGVQFLQAGAVALGGGVAIQQDG